MARTTEENLGHLVELLRAGWLTAKDIRLRTSCSKPTAYARIAALRVLGYPIVERDQRQGATGPMSKHYHVEGTKEQ